MSSDSDYACGMWEAYMVIAYHELTLFVIKVKLWYLIWFVFVVVDHLRMFVPS